MNPTSARAHLLYESGRFDLAATEFRKILAFTPDDAYAHSRLAICLFELNDCKQAYQEARTAISISPSSAYSHYAYAFILHRNGNQSLAEKTILEALRLDQWNAHYYSVLSYIYLAQSKWKNALQAAEQGLRINPHDSTCSNNRTTALINLGRGNEAIDTAKSTLSRNPDDPENHTHMGWALLEAKDISGAEKHFREALRLDPTNDYAKSGMMRAIKARNPAYRFMLSYFNWIGRLAPAGRWTFVIGLFILRVIVPQVMAHYPSFAPYGEGFIAIYFIFWLSTWVADPVATAMLRFDKFGRFLLNRRQITASNLVGAALAFVAITVIIGIFRQKLGWPLLGGGMFMAACMIARIILRSNAPNVFLYGGIAIVTILVTLGIATSIGL